MDRYPPHSSCPHSLNTAEIGLAESADSDPSQPRSSVHGSVPIRLIVPQRNSSGTAMHSKKDTKEFKADDAWAMSPRRSSEDIEVSIRELRAELSRHAKLLRESLHLIVTRIETVRTQQDMLDSNNKLMENYIKDLESMSRTVASGSREKN